MKAWLLQRRVSLQNMIPKRYEDVDFEKLPAEIRQKYPLLRQERRGLYIWGGVGTGKTYAAYGIYKKWNEDRKKEECDIRAIEEKYVPQNGMRTNEKGEMYYFEDKETKEKLELEIAKLPKVRPMIRVENVPEMLYQVRKDFKKENEYRENLLETRKVIVLDDIGVEKVSEFVEEFMYLLINTQYEKVYPMVITSNLPLSKLAEKLGDRVVSRIKEMCEVIEIKGEDKRLGK